MSFTLRERKKISYAELDRGVEIDDDISESEISSGENDEWTPEAETSKKSFLPQSSDDDLPSDNLDYALCPSTRRKKTKPKKAVCVEAVAQTIALPMSDPRGQSLFAIPVQIDKATGSITVSTGAQVQNIAIQVAPETPRTIENDTEMVKSESTYQEEIEILENPTTSVGNDEPIPETSAPHEDINVCRGTAETVLDPNDVPKVDAKLFAVRLDSGHRWARGDYPSSFARARTVLFLIAYSR